MIKLVFPIFSLLALGNGFTIQPRVVNGVLSNTTNFPFFVMIEQVMPPTRCSATLISDRYSNMLVDYHFSIKLLLSYLRLYLTDGFSQPPTV